MSAASSSGRGARPAGESPPAGEARPRGVLLRWGLPRDPSASAHLAGFVVTTVATVLLTRAFLAATGYPQIGGDGLHLAHVLWGGLLMAVAFVILLSFAGPVARPLGSVVGGIGFGLFIDEIGKFVTADNDYFYEPTAALIYVVVVVLVLVAEAMHGRRPHHPAEYVAGAADHAVAGIAGGFTPQARAQAHALLDRAGDVPGAIEVRALVAAVEDDAAELPNPIATVGSWVVRATRWLVAARWVPWLTVGVLLATLAGTVAGGVAAWAGGVDVPVWVIVALLGSAGVSAVVAIAGLVVVGRDRLRGYVLFRRAVLVSLLVTQVFVFRIEQWSATTGLLLDLIVLGLISAELQQMARAREASPARGAPPVGR